MSAPAIVFPGQHLGPVGTAHPGIGTHVHAGQIRASLFGQLTSIPPVPKSSPAVPTFTVVPVNQSGAGPNARRRPLVPTTNGAVLGKVVRLFARQASVSIIAIEAIDPATGEKTMQPCLSPFPALLRVQDIRATEKDKVKMLDSMHVGDIIKAVVISLGDQASYYISTARNDLGVIMAWTTESTAQSALGEQLLPISWNEMMAAQSGKRETRKVAKPL